MLDAIIFAIRSVGTALGIYLNIPVPFTGNITVRVYDVIVFLFTLAVFWKLLAMILTKAASTPVPMPKRNKRN